MLHFSCVLDMIFGSLKTQHRTENSQGIGREFEEFV